MAQIPRGSKREVSKGSFSTVPSTFQVLYVYIYMWIVMISHKKDSHGSTRIIESHKGFGRSSTVQFSCV